MILMLSISVVINVLLIAAVIEMMSAIRHFREKNENINLAYIEETKNHELTLIKLRELESARNSTATAEDIVKNQPNRLKNRLNWSDMEQRLEEKHNTKEKKHLDLVREMENIPYLGDNPEKE